MDNYLMLKMLHILSSMILIGTGAGIAFFMLIASRSNSPQGLLVVTKIVVLADWVFTAPAVIVQLVSGVLLMQLLGYSFTSPWFITVFSLFLLIGACWLPVVWIQYKLRFLASQMASTDCESSAASNRFRGWMKVWMLLGVPAFSAIIVILYLMVFKPISII